MNRFGNLWIFVEEFMGIWNDVKPNRMAAALAYYGMFSFVPVVYIALSVAGIFINDILLSQEVYTRMVRAFGSETAAYILDLVQATEGLTDESSTLATLISVGALLYAASSMFTHLKYSLNTIWQVPLYVSGGTINFIKNRLLAFLLVIGIGLVMIAAAFYSFVASTLTNILPFDLIDPFLNAMGLIAIATVCFAILFRILPDIHIRWRDVWLGAFVTALLVMIGIWGIGVYFSISGMGSAFEAAGALAILLIWIYYIAQIFLAGAVFTKAYATVFGSNPKTETEF